VSEDTPESTPTRLDTEAFLLEDYKQNSRTSPPVSHAVIAILAAA
jgi:hypothetical protein